MLTYFTLQFSG